MILDMTLEEQPWERLLREITEGQRISGTQLLTCLEGATEEEAEDVLETLSQRRIQLDISDLPKAPFPDASAQRLRLEQTLAEQPDMTCGLEQNDPLRLYLEELAGIPVAGDVNRLALEIEKPGIREQLLNLMLSRTVEAVRCYVGRGVLLLDLLQEASLGLWQGLSSYVSGDLEEHCDWWIHQKLRAAVLLQARSAGVGQKLRQAMEDYRSVDERLLAELGRNPLPEELAEALHLTVEETQVIATMVASARKMDMVRRPEPEQLPQEEDQAVEDTAYFQMRQRIAELLSGLSKEDAKLLSLRYGLEGGLPMEPEQVGQKLGLTPQEVINREAAALAKLRQ